MASHTVTLLKLVVTVTLNCFKFLLYKYRLEWLMIDGFALCAMEFQDFILFLVLALRSLRLR